MPFFVRLYFFHLISAILSSLFAYFSYMFYMWCFEVLNAQIFHPLFFCYVFAYFGPRVLPVKFNPSFRGLLICGWESCREDWYVLTFIHIYRESCSDVSVDRFLSVLTTKWLSRLGVPIVGASSCG